MYIGYVSNINFPCENILNHSKVKFIIKANKGYEGVTTSAMKKYCHDTKSNSLIMYIHNRGVSHNPDTPSEDWTLMMEYFVIENWKKSINLLTDKYTCGCELTSHQHRLNPKDFIFHYSGNFWWSRSEYIKLLPYPLFNNRFMESEDWILQLADKGINKEHFGILHRTSRERYKTGIVESYIDRYPFKYYSNGKETPDIELDITKFHG